MLGVWSYAESPTFEQALSRTFGEVRVEELIGAKAARKRDRQRLGLDGPCGRAPT